VKTLLTIIFLTLTLTIYSQTKDTIDIIIDRFEQMPIFPGGLDALYCFVENNFNYDILNDDQTQMDYFIKFSIDSIGRAKDFNFIATRPQSISNVHLDSLKREEILRVFRLMPEWEPALQNGRKISCWFTISIKTPYTEFKCEAIQDKKHIEFQPDSLAQFKIGFGKNNKERIDQYIYNQLNWPSQDDCYGRVIIKCIVEKSGKLTNFKFVRRLCPYFDNEALRVVKQMPKWSPAIKNNRPVRSVIVIPFLFRLQ
jgi:TonB family protein